MTLNIMSMASPPPVPDSRDDTKLACDYRMT
jgi:hypothetical protein